MFRKWILPTLVLVIYWLWTKSWRKQIVEPPAVRQAMDQGQPIIFAHWHGDELAITHLVPKYQIATMTSTSKDGQLIDFVIRKMGGATSRGSSTRGGIGALKGLVRLVRSGYRASMAVDGPKGPLHVVKPGVFELSRLANALIVPVGVAAQPVIVFRKSWNKAILPKPFSRVVVHFGEPFPALTKQDDSKDAKWAKSLASALFDAHNQAAKLIAGR